MGIFKSGAQARASTGNSIRGKISGPISVSNSLDDSFPFRGPGVTSSPVDTYGRMTDLPLPPAPPQNWNTAQSPSSYAPSHSMAQAYPINSTVHPQTTPYNTQSPTTNPSYNTNPLYLTTNLTTDDAEYSTFSHRVSSHSSPQRTVAGSADTVPNPDPVRFSGVSIASHHSYQSNQNNRNVPQRKKSTLRNTLGRLFGRKRKDGSNGSNELDGPIHPIEEEDSPTSPRALRHTLGGSVERVDDDTEMAEPKRSNSLPITEFGRALRSHSIGPDDMSMIESARNSLQTEFSFSRRRAATTGSRAPSYPQRTDELMGLTPRPAGGPQSRGNGGASGGRAASAMANLDRNDEPTTPAGYPQGLSILVGARNRDSDAYDASPIINHPDPGEIGKAITSDGRQFTLQQHKRRSRSLSGLPNLGLDRDGVRRRSDEIRYWKENMPRLSLLPHAIGTANGGDPTSQEVSPVSTNKNTPHPFDFGAVPLSPVSPISPIDKNDAAITTQSGTTISNRLTGIEARVRQIEEMMSAPPPLPVPQPPPPRFKGSIFGDNPSSSVESAFTVDDSSSPRSLGRSTSGRMSFGDGPTIGRLHPPPPVAPVTVKVVRPGSGSSTLRGVSSLPSLTKQANAIDQTLHTTESGVLTMDHYNALIALINTERTERQELMSQVRKLERRVALFTNGSVAVGHVAHRESSFMLEPPPTAKSFGERSFFDEQEDEDETEDDKDNCATVDVHDKRHRCEPHPEDSGVVGHSAMGDDHDDDSFSDEFFTPRENYLSPPHGVGAFGEPLCETGGKKAARTLSLSQLTLPPPTAY